MHWCISSNLRSSSVVFLLPPNAKTVISVHANVALGTKIAQINYIIQVARLLKFGYGVSLGVFSPGSARAEGHDVGSIAPVLNTFGRGSLDNAPVH